MIAIKFIAWDVDLIYHNNNNQNYFSVIVIKSICYLVTLCSRQYGLLGYTHVVSMTHKNIECFIKSFKSDIWPKSKTFLSTGCFRSVQSCRAIGLRQEFNHVKLTFRIQHSNQFILKLIASFRFAVFRFARSISQCNIICKGKTRYLNSIATIIRTVWISNNSQSCYDEELGHTF